MLNIKLLSFSSSQHPSTETKAIQTYIEAYFSGLLTETPPLVISQDNIGYQGTKCPTTFSCFRKESNAF